jgi:hypothetical protein
MRRTIGVAIVAGCLGFLLATATSHAGTLLNIWRAYGENFQLGYVVGYLDAIVLAQRKDPRSAIPTQTGKNFDRWVKGVNEYFEDPAHAKKSVPDAMAFVGNQLRTQWLEEWALKLKKSRPTPQPSPGT